jgi:GT2 family glycosyltransferase
MDLSIVIVSWNTRDLLDDCLASLPAATGDLETEILVVDNASADGSAQMVQEKYPQARLLAPGANLGFTGGNNLAFKDASGDAVLMLNPDTVCEAGSLKTLHDFLFATPGAGAVGPTLLDDLGHAAITWGNFPAVKYHLLELLGNHRTRQPAHLRELSFVRIPDADQPTRRVDYVSGACMMIRRDALKQIGHLDERFFMYFEETDWCIRAKRAGLDIYHCVEARVKHLEGRAAKKAGAFTLAQFHKSYRLFVAKNYGPGRVMAFRAAIFLEYACKGVARRLLSRLSPSRAETSRLLADNYFRTAALQLQGEIKADPPR